MVPEPLAFPRAPYADTLALHAKLLARFEDKLLAEAREFGAEDSPFEHLHDYVGLIVPRPMGVTVDMVGRRGAIELTRALHGISRALYLTPRQHRFRVLILARGLMSLHTLEIEGAQTDAPRLRLVSRDDVVEPRKQEHRNAGAYTVTRWVAFDREARHAWRPTPTEPASWEEAADRLLALYDGQLRDQLQGYLSAGHDPAETFVQVRSTTRGDRIQIVDRGMLKVFTWSYPEIGHAIAETEHPTHIPLIVCGNGWGALRWIAAGAPDGGPPPPSMVEAMTLPPDLEEPEEPKDHEDDEAPARAPAKPRRKPTEIEIVDMLFKMGIDDEVDRLTTLTSAEIDGEIASAGFDPEAERAFGPGLRHRVLEWLMRKSIAAEGEP